MSREKNRDLHRISIVLILIILEVTLWVNKVNANKAKAQGLNPYYTGSYSMSSQDFDQQLKCINGLNPYYTGSYSMRNLRFGITKKVSHVLILIILEVTLWVDAIVKLDISQIES